MTQDNLVIGCGVIGLTTALELLRRGQRVTLIDAAAHEGLGTSFANAGLLTPSMPDPWNAPGVHRHLVEYMVNSSSAFKLRLKALPSLMTWGPKFLLNSRPEAHRRATIANLDLAIYSMEVLKQIRFEHALSFDASDRGALKFFREAAAFDTAVELTRALADHGLPSEVLDRDGAVRFEPLLAPIREKIAGAISYPGDGCGDAHLFCRAAARVIADMGGTFIFDREVLEIEKRNGRVTGVRTSDGTIRADQVIVAAGVASPELTAKLGLNLAVKPVKGYSMTYDLDPSGPIPGIPVIDDAYHAALTPLGSRLRVAGTAEFAGRDVTLDRKRVENLATLFKATYPQLATETQLKRGRPWAGLRPVAADGRPYIGPGPLPGLWVNSGHGHLGWTLAAGSARLVADLMSGKKPEIDASAYAPAR